MSACDGPKGHDYKQVNTFRVNDGPVYQTFRCDPCGGRYSSLIGGQDVAAPVERDESKPPEIKRIQAKVDRLVADRSIVPTEGMSTSEAEYLSTYVDQLVGENARLSAEQYEMRGSWSQETTTGVTISGQSWLSGEIDDAVPDEAGLVSLLLTARLDAAETYQNAGEIGVIHKVIDGRSWFSLETPERDL